LAALVLSVARIAIAWLQIPDGKMTNRDFLVASVFSGARLASLACEYPIPVYFTARYTTTFVDNMSTT
jgi:hypothetical protein